MKPAPALVPMPRTVHARDGAFVLTPTLVVTGHAEASALLRSLVHERCGVALTDSQQAPHTARQITVNITEGGAPESYRVEVSRDAVLVTGADAAGLQHGAHTLVQLICRQAENWAIPAIEIEDAPRFTYRGVMLDVARHFHSVHTVQGYIDRAVALKFNVLHLHLTDDQGWRLHVASRPELTKQGSASSVHGDPGGFYTAAEYREIVEYAAARHMTVVPEIDVPGHTHAVGLAYPALAEAPVITPEIEGTVAEFGGGLPAPGVAYTGLAVGFSSLVIGSADTDAFISDVLADVAAMTPGPYLHVGGDEALGTPPEAFASFMARATQIVHALGKTPIAWHEAGAAAGPAGAVETLHPTTIGQYWGFVEPTDGMDEKTRTFAAAGAQVILSPSDAVYLDMKQTEGDALGLTWARGVTSLERSYQWEPTEVIEGIGEREILGIEAPLWTETIATAADIDAMAFPRIAAAAEAAWSAQSVREWNSFRTRIGGLGPLWERAGIQFTRTPDIEWACETSEVSA